MKAPGHRILIRPDDVKETTQKGIEDVSPTLAKLGFDVAVNKELEREYKSNTSEGIVISIGPTAWMAYDYYTPDGKRNPAWEPWCKVWDRVVFAKYAAKWYTINDIDYVMVNDQDIIVALDNTDEVPKNG